MRRSRKATFKQFRLDARGAKVVLGALEADIMEILWRVQSASVREIHDRISARKRLAYTTVMTVMDRLYKKELLSRVAAGNGYLYSVAISKAEFQKALVAQVLRHLWKEFQEPVLSHFIEGGSLGNEDRAVLQKLVVRLTRSRGGEP